MQVINETVRLANIVPGIFRKTLRETKFKGTYFHFFFSFFFTNYIFIYRYKGEKKFYKRYIVCCGAGYTIPAGWAVMVCPPAVHLDPSKYENPLEFNPWRWEASLYIYVYILYTYIYVCHTLLYINSSNAWRLLTVRIGCCAGNRH